MAGVSGLETIINAAWEDRAQLGFDTHLQRPPCRHRANAIRCRRGTQSQQPTRTSAGDLDLRPVFAHTSPEAARHRVVGSTAAIA